MAIVDFEQDPEAPFGTGNFRDEKGRVMYLRDPETAGRFTKTMRGAPSMGGFGSQVSSESDAIARQQLGSPGRTPDRRLAYNAEDAANDQATTARMMQEAAGIEEAPPRDPTAAALAAPPQGAPQGRVVHSGPGLGIPSNELAPTTPAAALDEPLPAAPGAPPPATGTPEQQSAAQKVRDFIALKPAAPVAPGAPGAPAPTTGGPGETRTALGNIASYLALGQAGDKNKTQTQTTDGSSTQLGRREEDIQRQIDTSKAAEEGLDQKILSQGATRDATNVESLGAEEKAEKQRMMRSFKRGVGAIDERKAAQKRVEALNKELEKNDSSLDPNRLVNSMSTGKRVGMVILAALNGGFGALIGQKENGVIAALQDAIDRDIDQQKNQIARRGLQINNKIAEYMRQGQDADTAEKLARDAYDVAIDKVFGIQAKRPQVAREFSDAAQLLVDQRREARMLRRGELIAQGEDRRTETEQTTEMTEEGQTAPDILKLIQTQNALTDLTDADSFNKIIDPSGATQLSPDRVKETKAAVKEVMPRLAELSGAIEATEKLATMTGGLANTATGELSFKDPATGEDVDLRGVGPADSRPSGKHLAGMNPVSFAMAAASKVSRWMGFERADYDEINDQKEFVKEYVTTRMTGANSSIRQDGSFTAMVGGDLGNEEQFKQNLQNFYRTLIAERQAVLAGVGPAGAAWYDYSLQRAREGMTTGEAAPPLQPWGQQGAAPGGAAPAAPAAPGAAPTAPAGPPMPPGAPGTPNEKTAEMGGLTPELENEILTQSDYMDLNGEHVLRIIGFETAGSFSPATVAANSASHAGLLQFGRGEWQAAARLGGRPDITWEQAQQMTAEEQLPFALVYLKNKGLTRDSGIDEYYMALAAPAMRGKPDDLVVYPKGTKEAAGNAPWDVDRDGNVTVGEIRRVAFSLRRPRPRGPEVAAL